MALISFFTPTDKDILNDLKVDANSIKFVGSGSFSQKIDSIKYSRIFRLRQDSENQLRKVIYYKQGRVWKLSKIIPCNNIEH